MPPPSITFTEDDDVTVLESVTFSDLEAGSVSAEQEIHVHNDLGGAVGSEDATGVLLDVLSRDAGTSDPFTLTHPVAAHRMVELRLDGVIGTGIAEQETSHTPVGKGRALSALDIPAETGRKVFMRLRPVAGLGATAAEVKLRVRCNGIATPLEAGHYESGAQGVITGTGDRSFSELFAGGVVTATGTPDADIHVSDLRWTHKGIPKCKLAHAITPTNTDSAAAALASGESYWITLSAGASSTLTQTKSLKGTSPLSTSLRPAVPEGEVFIAYVEREFDATIESADIYQDELRYGFMNTTFSGTNALVDPGRALVGNALIIRRTRATVLLTLSATNTLWLLPSGVFEVSTDGTPPADMALAFWEATCDGSGVTSSRDLRTWTGPRRIVVPLTAANPSGFAINDLGPVFTFPSQAQGYIPHGDDAVFMGLDASGATSGSTRFDVQKSEDGVTWTSFFTTGPGTNGPSVAFGAAVHSASAPLAEDRVVPRLSLLRLKCLDTAGASPAKQACVLLPVEVP